MIGLDVMGGDFSPEVPVQAAVAAINEYKIAVLLIGDKSAIENELKKYNYNKNLLEIAHCESSVAMGDSVIQSLRNKESSLYKAFQLHKENKIEGVVSAGNSGAVLAIGKSVLKTLDGIDKPCISAIMPCRKGKMLLLDAGANIDCSPQNLLQFSVIGSVYANKFLNIPEPKVALLNIGEEESKGSETIKKAYHLLKDAEINFIGNIEGKDIFIGDADVIIADGLIGNILLKTAEGTVAFIQLILKKQLKKSLRSKIGALLLKKDFTAIKKQIDYAEYGGAPLLGLNGIAIVCHGSSRSDAITYAIRYAKWSADCNYVDTVAEQLNKINNNFS